MRMVSYRCHVGMKLYHVRECVDIPDLVVDILYYFYSITKYCVNLGYLADSLI